VDYPYPLLMMDGLSKEDENAGVEKCQTGTIPVIP